MTVNVCGDIEKLPLAAASVDLVWSSLAMQWCDTAAVTREAHRVLTSGGHLVASTLGPATFVELRRAFVGVDEFRHTNDFIDLEALRQHLIDAGLTPIELQRVEMVQLLTTICVPCSPACAILAPIMSRPPITPPRPDGQVGVATLSLANYEAHALLQRGLPLTYDTYFHSRAKNERLFHYRYGYRRRQDLRQLCPPASLRAGRQIDHRYEAGRRRAR